MIESQRQCELLFLANKSPSERRPAVTATPPAADLGIFQIETINASRGRQPQTVVFGAFQNPFKTSA